MIPEPSVQDRVAQVVEYLNQVSGLFYGSRESGQHLGENFDALKLLNSPLAGTILRGWNGGPFVLLHRTGGQVVSPGLLEDVTFQFDAYGPTQDDAFDVSVWARESLNVAPLNIAGCVVAVEIMGPMLLPDFDQSLDAHRYIFQWRLRFRL